MKLPATSTILLAALAAAQHSNHHDNLLNMPSLVKRDVNCVLTYPTDAWTFCVDVLVAFNITLEYFVAANPGLAADCDGFEPGSEYCVQIQTPAGEIPANATFTLPDPVVVSSNGICGAQTNWTVTCVGSLFGDCCSSSGYCGNTTDYCGEGLCQEGHCDGGLGPIYSLDGRCGTDFDETICGSNYGENVCCSTSGWCGTTEEFCGTGNCQSGACEDAVADDLLRYAPPGSPSYDGTCGFENALVCPGSGFGNCCSAAGYCGRTQYYCDPLLGCQSEFGNCTDGAETTTTTTSGTGTPTSTTTSAASSTTSGPVSTPTPIQSGMVDNCNSFHLVVEGDGCWAIANDAGIDLDVFYTWNPAIGTDCAALWKDYYVCIGIAG